MTPEEKAVIEAAMELASEAQGRHTMQPRWGSMNAFIGTVNALIYSCPQCNAGGHTCPGDGNPIGHTQTDCGQHEEPDHSPGSADVLGVYCDDPKHCPPTDSCRCSRTERVYCHVENCHGGADVQEWMPATLVHCLAGDHIRIGTDETDVVRCSSGIWHADISDAWRPKKWNHLELRMELVANPGFQEYPPNTPCEILCTPERKAVLLLQARFPGSAVTSSDVD